MDKKELLSRKFLEKGLDSIPIAFFMKDTDSKHVYINKVYCTFPVRHPQSWLIAGSARENILGKTDTELHPEEMANKIRKGDLETIAKGTGFSHQKWRRIGHDGLVLTWESIKAPVKDDEGNVTHLAGVIIDTTERRGLETIARIKQNLRGLSGLATGMELILDTVLEEFDRDAGVVLLIDRKMNLARVQAFKSRVEGLEVDESYPLDGGLTELKILDKGGSFSKVVDMLEPSILGTPSVSCIPVYLGRKLHGILALGDRKGRILEKSHLDVLELYGDLVSTVFETESLTIKPIKEKIVVKKKRQFKLEPGYQYLIKGEVEKAFEIFVDQVFGGFEGLCITREFPPRIRERYRLEKTPMVWLNQEKIESETTIHSLQDVSLLASQFLKKAKHGIVLLDSFEYLIENHGFKPFIQFLQLMRGRIELSSGNLIAPVLEGALDMKESKLIEKEMKLLAS